MAAPFNNLRSKNDRAWAAYLISAGCGSPDDVLPNRSTKSKEFPNTVVHSVFSKVEVHFTGSRRVTTHFRIKGKAVPDDNDASRIEFDNRVGLTADALAMTDDNRTLEWLAEQVTVAGRALAVPEDPNDADSVALAKQNADMADYTCQSIYEVGEGDGEKDDTDPDGCDWCEVLMLDVVCCASNVD